MNTVARLLFDLLWLGAAGAMAYLFPRTVLTVEGLALLITLALYLAERRWGGGIASHPRQA